MCDSVFGGNDSNYEHEKEESDMEMALKAELTRYKKEPQIQMKDALGNWRDPLLWWKEKHLLYPRLSALAMDYLPIQATSAASERTFSISGLVISDRRCSLLPENASHCVFLKNALPLAEKYEAVTLALEHLQLDKKGK